MARPRSQPRSTPHGCSSTGCAAPSARRRLAAITLALFNAGVGLRAAFAQALYTSHRFNGPIEPFFAPAPWLASRVALLAGTLLLSLLILRRSPR